MFCFSLESYFGSPKQCVPHFGKQINEWHFHGIDQLEQLNNLSFSGSFGEILGILMSTDKDLPTLYIWILGNG